MKYLLRFYVGRVCWVMNALLLPVSCPLVSRLQPKFWTIFFLINFCLLLLIFQSILFFFRVPTFVQECHRNVMYNFFSKSTFARVSNHHHLLVRSPWISHSTHGVWYKEFLYIFFACTYCAARPQSTRTYFFFFFWCKTHFFRLFFFLPIFYVLFGFFSCSALQTCIITVFYLFYTSFNITILLLSTQKHPPCIWCGIGPSMWLSWLYFTFVQIHTDIQGKTLKGWGVWGERTHKYDKKHYSVEIPDPTYKHFGRVC